MFDADQIRKLAAALKINARFIEKDWHVVQAISAIGALGTKGVTPAFSGGTSLAAAWQLIQRFSEDIDFKINVSAASPSAERRIRSAYRESVIEALNRAGYAIEGEPLVGNESRFFRASFQYDAVFPAAPGVRPHLQVEMTFTGTHEPPVVRPVQSLLGRALKTVPEVPAILCVDPVETAADKISALAWRTATRNRDAADDDPAVIRHLHDLAALMPLVETDKRLQPLARTILEADVKRTKQKGIAGVTLLRAMLPKITDDPLWRQEYDQFVGAVSYGSDDQRISFDQAIEACRKLAATIQD